MLQRMAELAIRTREPGWFTRLAKAYREKAPILLVDDAGTGLDPASQTLVSMGIKAAIATTSHYSPSLSPGR